VSREVKRRPGVAYTIVLLTLLATPVFYSLFDDAATRFAPRAWLGRLFGRRAPRAVTADGFRS
jgi:hypothetical protein